MPSSRVVCPRLRFSVGWDDIGKSIFRYAVREADGSLATLELAWWSEKGPKDWVGLQEITGQAVLPGELCELIRLSGGVVSASIPLPELYWGDPVETFLANQRYGDILNKLQGEHRE